MKKIIALFVIVISLIAWLPSASAAPAGQVTREYGILGLSTGKLPRLDSVCLGSNLSLVFMVKNVAPGMEVPIPVAEANVSASDNQGRTKDAQTDGAGSVHFSWPTSKEGTLKITVQANKNYYKPAQPINLQITIVNCQWVLSIHFHEEYALIKEMSLVEGATTTWKGTLKAQPPTGEDPVSDVILLDGSGTYQFYADDQNKAPFHFTIDPPISGDYELKIKGRSDGRTVTLDIGTTPVSYPKVATMKVTDYSNRGIEVPQRAPATTSGGNGLFLELNHLSEVTFPVSGGVIGLDSGMSCYFYTPDRTKYSLELMLFPLSGDNSSVQDGTMLEGRLP